MAKPTYWELLKHPNWQRKRLEILDRAYFQCESCDSDTKTLNVHHTYYEKGKAPWEYPSESLQCLCEGCHSKAQDLMTLMHRQIGKVASDLPVLYGFAMALEAASFPQAVVQVSSYEVADGVGRYWGLSPDDVINLLRDGCVDGMALCNYSRAKRGMEPFQWPATTKDSQ